MIKREMVKKLATQMGITYTAADAIFNQVVGVIRDSIIDSDRVKVNGLGMFHKRLQKNRKGYNPATGESVEVSSYTAVTFRASKKLKESI